MQRKYSELFIEPELEIDTAKRQRASYVRKTFYVSEELESAVIKISACGLYKAYINGVELDKQCFLPGFTFYEKRLQYQEYEISEKLHPGENVIGAVIGDGWYRGRIGLYEKTNFYGEKIKLFCILHLKYKNGTEEEIVTDTSWKATQNGPIGKNDLKTGEEYDARLEMNKWNKSGFDDSQWHNVRKSTYEGTLVPSEGERILEQEHFYPVVLKTPDGNTVLDFGQNISGYVKFKVTGKSGQQVKLIHGETLDENGNFTLKNLELEGGEEKKEPFGQMIKYTLKDGLQEYKPTFANCGFQYVILENWPEEVKPENFEAIAVYSDIHVDGKFRCSNELVNQLVENLKWSEKSNFVDIPTDCPTRERAGWTGDIAVFSETACYVSDPEKFLKKWMKDVVLQQKENGNVPFIVPEVGLEEEAYGSAGWADVIYQIPFNLYRFYGKREILEEYYEPVKRWVEFNRKRAKAVHPDNKNRTEPYWEYILDTGFHFGEWLEPGSVMLEDSKNAAEHPDSEVATAYYAYSAGKLSEMAEILGKKEEAQEYRDLYKKIVDAYRKEFIKEGHVVSDRQCRFVRPVLLDLVTEEEKKNIVKDLNEKVIANNYKIGTGFLTTAGVLKVLCEQGYVDTAYRMLENTEQPGWLYAVTKGAKSIWENWYGKDSNNVPRDSMNHYAPGSVVAWLFNTVAGINPLRPGYEEISISPVPGGTLRWAEAETKTCRGWVKSSWHWEGNKFVLKIQVPEKTKVCLPDKNIYWVEAGKWQFSCLMGDNNR